MHDRVEAPAGSCVGHVPSREAGLDCATAFERDMTVTEPHHG
jgi:hypothetical protein